MPIRYQEWFHIVISVVLGEIGAGMIVGFVLFVGLLVRMTRSTSILVTPQTFKNEREKAGDKKGDFGPDVAWPWYFRRQVFADKQDVFETRRDKVTQWLVGLLIGDTFRITDSTSSSPHRKFSKWRKWFMLFSPLLCIPTLVAIIFMALCNILFEAVAYVVILLVWPGYLLTVWALRGLEAAWSMGRKTSASCPACFYVSKRPAYRCDGCGRLHRDVRPSRLGIFYRRCECGEVMPTMTLRAAWRETAVCQRCEEQLRQGAAAVRDIRLPIFGDVAAGKTRFLYAALDSMRHLGSKHAITVSFPDTESQQRADTAMATMRTAARTVKTDPTHPTALSFRLGSGNSGSLVHMFDAAGELYNRPDDYDQVSFLDSGHGLVYVVDPFTLSGIRSQVSGFVSATEHLDTAAGKDPETAYGQVVTRLRGGGVKAKDQRLAVVISKTDVLYSCAVDFPTESSAISEWLMENGLHNIVLAAPNEFAEVRYFAVASVAAKTAAPETDAGAPVRWLLRKEGVKLPSEEEINPKPEAEAEVKA